MRNIDNIVDVPLQKSSDTLYLTELPDFETQDYDLFDEKQFRRYINDIKRMVRNSIEYSLFREYLIQNMDMNQDAFYENIGNYDGERKVKLHIHHEPFTLEDIAQIVFNKRVAYNESIDIELVSKEVMFLHFGLVGLCCLTSTNHKLVHNNYLFVPLDRVFGNYKKFKELYKPFIEPEMLDTLERLEEATFTKQPNTDILRRSDIYLEFGNKEYQIPDNDHVKSIINCNSSSNDQHNDKKGQFIIPAIIVNNKEE